MRFLVHHLLRDSAARYPAKEALVHKAERVSYEAAWRSTSGLAAGLRAAGVKRTDRVGVLLEPSLPLAISLLGVSRAGGAFVPIHHSLLADQIEHILCDCSMKGFITDASRMGMVQELAGKCPSLEFVVVVGATDVQCGELRQLDFETLCDGEVETLAEVAISKDLAAILYTSGSTGKPKGVMLSHANVIAGAEIVSDYLGIGPADRTLAVLPLSFDAGLNQLMTALLQGATCVMMSFLFAREIVGQLEQEQITGLASVPSLWNLLAQKNSRLAETSLPNLRYISNTGGAMPLNVLEKLRAAIPETKVFLMYGLTEAFRSTYLPPEQVDQRPTSIGKAIPNTEILVVNDAGGLCGPGEVGELVHRGPTVSLGYWGHPELTNRMLRPYPFAAPEIVEVEKVCYSGDLVRMDEEGYLFFVGRRDNLIKSSGFRVSPTDVEQALCKAGQLREAAVIGLPDEALGQRIKAFVVPHDGATIDPGALLEAVAALLPRHMLPKEVAVLATLPKTSSGKINYPALRERELSATPAPV